MVVANSKAWLLWLLHTLPFLCLIQCIVSSVFYFFLFFSLSLYRNWISVNKWTWTWTWTWTFAAFERVIKSPASVPDNPKEVSHQKNEDRKILRTRALDRNYKTFTLLNSFSIDEERNPYNASYVRAPSEDKT